MACGGSAGPAWSRLACSPGGRGCLSGLSPQGSNVSSRGVASPPPTSVFSPVKWVTVRFKGANAQGAFSKDITRVPFAVTPGDSEDKEWVPQGCLKAPGE